MITAIFPFLLGLLAIFTPETKYGHTEHMEVEEESDILLSNNQSGSNQNTNDSQRRPKVETESNICRVFKFVSKPQILKPIIFIFLFLLTPSMSSAMFYYFTNFLKFEPEFMGQLRLIQAFANMLGIYLYNRYFKLVAFKVVFGVSAFFGAALGMCDLLLVTR